MPNPLFPTPEISPEKKRKLFEELSKPYTPAEDETPIEKEGFIYIPSIKIHIAKEKTLHSKNWYEMHSELHKQELYMPTIPEFIEFLKYLRSQPDNEEYQEIYKEITEVREPWSREYLDAKFEIKDSKTHIHYNHRTVNGILEPKNNEILHPNTLMQDKASGIDLESWLNNPTPQGFPTNDTPNGSLYYWYPNSTNRVARFYAGSDRAGLICYGNPSDADYSLRVRAVRRPLAENSGGKK